MPNLNMWLYIYMICIYTMHKKLCPSLTLDPIGLKIWLERTILHILISSFNRHALKEFSQSRGHAYARFEHMWQAKSFAMVEENPKEKEEDFFESTNLALYVDIIYRELKYLLGHEFWRRAWISCCVTLKRWVDAIVVLWQQTFMINYN